MKRGLQCSFRLETFFRGTGVAQPFAQVEATRGERP